nr:unnamed protein product [Spirometra erinaceieuropaei]
MNRVHIAGGSGVGVVVVVVVGGGGDDDDVGDDDDDDDDDDDGGRKRYRFGGGDPTGFVDGCARLQFSSSCQTVLSVVLSCLWADLWPSRTVLQSVIVMLVLSSESTTTHGDISMEELSL